MALPQQFQISLSGTLYTVRLYWNNLNQYWILDLSDASGNAIVQGVPLVSGALLLSQYKYLGLPGDLFVQVSDDPNAVPGFTDLGVTSQLYYASGVGAGAPVT